MFSLSHDDKKSNECLENSILFQVFRINISFIFLFCFNVSHLSLISLVVSVRNYRQPKAAIPMRIFINSFIQRELNNIKIFYLCLPLILSLLFILNCFALSNGWYYLIYFLFTVKLI